MARIGAKVLTAASALAITSRWHTIAAATEPCSLEAPYSLESPDHGLPTRGSGTVQYGGASPSTVLWDVSQRWHMTPDGVKSCCSVGTAMASQRSTSETLGFGMGARGAPVQPDRSSDLVTRWRSTHVQVSSSFMAEERERVAPRSGSWTTSG